MLILCLSVAIAVLDQVSKFAVRSRFRVGEQLPVIPGLFNLSYVRNTGAAWGIFAGFGNWLVVVSIVMLIVIVFFRHSFMNDGSLDRVAVGLMVGGIVGNLIDRVRLGYVVDFLDFHWKTHHFPAFNVADAAICTGVGLYILSQYLAERREQREQPQAGDDSRADA